MIATEQALTPEIAKYLWQEHRLRWRSERCIVLRQDTGTLFAVMTWQPSGELCLATSDPFIRCVRKAVRELLNQAFNVAGLEKVYAVVPAGGRRTKRFLSYALGEPKRLPDGTWRFELSRTEFLTRT